MAKCSKAEAVEPAASVAIRARARAVGVEAIDALLELARGAESESVQLAAIKELLDRGFGRAAAATPGENGAPLYVMLDDGYAQ